MSTYKRKNIRKRRSGDESSDIDDPPAVKRQRESKQVLKGVDKIRYIWDLPIKGYFKDIMLDQALEELSDVDDVTDEEVKLLCEENIAVDSDTDAESPHCDEVHSAYLRGLPNYFPKPVKTPFYRDGTMVGFKPVVSPMNRYHNIDPKPISNLRKTQKFVRTNRYITPITNPGLDVDILLDPQEVESRFSEELKILSEIGHGKQFSKFSRPLMPSMFDGTSVEPSDASHMDGKDSAPTTSRQDSKSLNEGYTAQELVRLREKVEYKLLLEKVVKKLINRPVKKETTVIEVETMKDENGETFPVLPFDREVLHNENIEDFFKKPYYKPFH